MILKDSDTVLVHNYTRETSSQALSTDALVEFGRDLIRGAVEPRGWSNVTAKFDASKFSMCAFRYSRLLCRMTALEKIFITVDVHMFSLAFCLESTVPHTKIPILSTTQNGEHQLLAQMNDPSL
jgi:hypothetical protein